MASPCYFSEKHIAKMASAACTTQENIRVARSLDANLDEVHQPPIRRLVIAYISLADLKSYGLFRRAKRRTEITEFVIDLVRAFDSLSNFFAE